MTEYIPIYAGLDRRVGPAGLMLCPRRLFLQLEPGTGLVYIAHWSRLHLSSRFSIAYYRERAHAAITSSSVPRVHEIFNPEFDHDEYELEYLPETKQYRIQQADPLDGLDLDLSSLGDF